MNCLEFQEWWQRTLDGETAPASMAEHVAGCATCRALQQTAQRAFDALRAEPTPGFEPISSWAIITTGR